MISGMRFWASGIVLTIGVIVLVLFLSHNGLRDWMRMHRQMKNVQSNIHIIEEANRDLRRRMDLLQEHSDATMEYYIRSNLGWVRPGERVYLEPDPVAQTMEQN